MTRSAELRALLASEPVCAVGCYDPLTALLVEQAGFKMVYVSGLAVEAGHLGNPDLGLITRTEMVQHAARIADRVGVPTICDADTGYGDAANVARTVREFERAGVAAIHIEDQEDPKQCPWLGADAILPIEEAVGRIAVAAQARTDPDFYIIARTDACGKSFDEAVLRANRYLAAGADAAMTPLVQVNGQSLGSLAPSEQIAWHARFCREVDGPTVGLRIPPGYRIEDMYEAGYQLVLLPTLTLQAVVSQVARLLDSLRLTGTGETFFRDNPHDPRFVLPSGDLSPLLKFLGADDIQALRDQATSSAG